MQIDFVKYDLDFLNDSWLWLNDPEIKTLTLTNLFTKQQQMDFYHSLEENKSYRIWGIKANNERIGVIGLKKITEFNAEYFGYIGNKSFWGKGISKSIFSFIKEEAKKLNLSKLYLHVSKNNSRAIKSYLNAGFKLSDENENENENENDISKMTLNIK